MRLRPARRFIRRLYVTGQIYVNWYEYLLSRGLVILNRSGYYHARVRINNQFHATRSSSAFRAIKSLYFKISTMAVVQGKLFDHSPLKTTQLRDFIGKIIETQSPDFPLVSAPDCGTVSFPTQKPAHPLVRKCIDIVSKDLDSRVLEEVNNYHHSSQIQDSALFAPAVNKLASRPLKPLDRDVAKRMIILYALREVKRGQKFALDLDYSTPKLASQSKNSGSASGYLPLKPIPGVCGKIRGTKREMHVGGVCTNIRDRDSSDRPCSLPFTNFIKPEVIKKSKPARGIQIESVANYNVLAMADQKENRFDRGMAIGLGKKDWGFQTIFGHWYVIYNRHTGNGWEDFIEFLKTSGAHESDKVGWESSTNITDGLPLAIVELGRLGRNTTANKRLFCRAYSDSMVPFITIDRSGFWAPWRVPSGTYRTSGGNTKRHGGENSYLCYFIRRHGNTLGTSECKCKVCTSLPPEYLDLHVDELLLKLRSHAFIMGDDYFAVSLGVMQDKAFDYIMDMVFGTQTKTETKPMFCGAEFLRRQFVLVGTSIFWYKETTRALAKLFHGDHRVTVERFSAAVTSAILECGLNEELFKVLIKIKRLLKPEPEIYKSELSAFASKTPHITDTVWDIDVTMEELYNVQNRTLGSIISALSAVVV